MSGIPQQQLTQLKMLIQMIKSSPSILHMPELGFLKEWLESMGANIPPPPQKTPKPEPEPEPAKPKEPEPEPEPKPKSEESDIVTEEPMDQAIEKHGEAMATLSDEFKPDIGCSTEGCESQGDMNGKNNTHKTAANCNLAWKHKQEEFQEKGGSAPKKQKIDIGASRGTSKERDIILPKQVSDIPCEVAIKQEPFTDEDYCTESQKALQNLSYFLSTIQNTSVSELSVPVKHEVDESWNSKTQVLSTDADILRKIGEGNAERIVQPVSDKSITGNLVNIDANNLDDKNIVTQTIVSKSVETSSCRKMAGNKEESENGGISMERRSPITTVVKMELDDDSDGGGVCIVVAEWTDRQLWAAGRPCAQKEDQGESTRPQYESNEDFDLDNKCYQKDGHVHKMDRLSSDEANGSWVQDAQENRRQSIQRCIQSLMHACQCRDANCRLPSCHKMKRVVGHSKTCKKTNSGCPICKQLIVLCCYHAKHCNENKCQVPFCLQIKQRIRQQQLKRRLQQTQMMRRRMLTIQRTQSSAPGPSPANPVGTQPIPSGKPAGGPTTAVMQAALEAQEAAQRQWLVNTDQG